MQTLEQVKHVLSDILQLGPRVSTWTAETRLLNSVPELDSMAVANVIAALEDHFGFVAEDDEISADTFSTVGSLAAYVDEKIG